MPGARIVIKKYGNRRMYDTSQSRYVNLDDLAELVRQGADVQVVDAKSGEDLTRVTLTQVIMEDAKDQPAGLPLELLRQLIVASDRARQDFLMWYLKSAFDSYQKVQEAIQNQLSGVRAATLAPLESVRRFFTGPAPPAVPAEASEIDQLRGRIAELENQLKKERRPPRKVRKKKKPRP
ncbi:MAG TPA: polyhydroxyalkanoate synthesis regulator DNA-binding domain-containing protein [Bryobacteraceae bacterium]|nr:polyhydroxyalkanoate synthesis regulator DNA-binding domain-containing protein [Bryobacteraceae bacterium]